MRRTADRLAAHPYVPVAVLMAAALVAPVAVWARDASPAPAAAGFDWAGVFVALGVIGWVASRMPGGLRAWGRRIRWAYDRLDGLYRVRKAEQEAVMNEAPPRPTGADPTVSVVSASPDPRGGRPAPAPPTRPAGAAPPIVQQVGRGPEPQDGIVSSAGGFGWPFGRK